MGAIIPVGYGQARHVFQLQGKPTQYVVTMGYDAQNDFSPATAAATIRGIWGGANGPFRANMMMSPYSYLGVECTEMTLTGPITGSSLSTLQGTGGAATLPPNCAMLVKKQTLLGGRKGRGRMFVPPLHFTETDVDALGNITPASLAGVVTAYNAALTAQNATEYDAMLLHSDATEPSLITGLSVVTTLATQRRRMR